MLLWLCLLLVFFFFSSRRRHTRCSRDWSSDVCSSDLIEKGKGFVHFHHTAYNAASVFALLRQPERAVYWLRQAAQTGWPCYPYFARDPNLDNIRNHPSVVAFLKQLKSQWQHYRATL